MDSTRSLPGHPASPSRRQAVEGDRRFRQLFDRIADPMLLLDLESGVFVDWNPAAMRMLNYPAREDVIALRPADISPPLQPDGRASEEKLQEMMDVAHAAGSHRFEWTLGSPFRNEVVVEALFTSMHLDGREVLITTWHDLSRQKSAERDLIATKLRWKYALEGAGDGVWDWNVQDGSVFFSPRWKHMLGYEDHEIGNNASDWSALVHPDDIGRAMTEMHAHLQGRTQAYRSEHRIRCRNGEYKWILDRGKVVSTDTHGQPLRVVGTHTDISERRRVQMELERADATQRALLDAMADGVFVAQDFRFVFVNPALPRMLGYTVEEFTGLHFRDVLHPDYLAIWSERFQRRISDGPEPQRRYEVQMLRRDRRTAIWIELIASRFTYRDTPAVLGIVRDISDKKINEQTIWKQANYDSLTNLPNRHLLLHHLQQEMRMSQRTGRKLAVLFIDLDRFKEVNDTLGHEAGDTLLQQAAQRITACMRDTDVVARFGGDEFAVVLGGLEHPEVVEQIGAKILSALHLPFQLGNELVYVSASIGITLYPDDAQSQDDLLKQADQAMYDAKRSGRNRMSHFTPCMQASSERRLRLVSDMHAALLAGQFQLHYQPIVDIASGRVHKAEALLRWPHPDRGHVSPAEFIPIAEETGLILPLGDWVTRTAIEFARHLQQRFDRTVQISINHSPVQLRNRNRDYPSVVELLKQTEQPGSLVVIEMTEGMLVEADEASLDSLFALRDAGVQVALDDFGTGYSSLSYLKKFDIDYLKIDQSFVRGLSRDSSELALCEAMIVMAHKLGMQVIAEGVETIHQLELLRAAGCDFAQGFLFSRPLQAEHFEAWLRENG